jgi:cytochrome c556
MSTSPETIRPKSSAFSRYLFVLIFGLALGAIGAVMLMNAWQQRQDPFPGSVMNVQAWHMKQLGEKAKLNRCAATDTIPHLKALRTMADDIELAFEGLREEERFVEHASNMRATLDASLASPPINCEGVNAAVGKIGESCKGCHDEFKS